jgi:hypothetical protein
MGRVGKGTLGGASWGGRRRLGHSGRARGGAGEPERSGVPALIAVDFRNGLGLGGIEVRELVEVVGIEFLGGLLCLATAGPHGFHGELSLGRPPGGMDEGGRGGLTDVGQNPGNGLGVGEGPERSGDRRRRVGVGAQ